MSSRNQTTRQRLDNLRAFILKHEDLWSSMGTRLSRGTPTGRALVRVLANFDQWFPTFTDRYLKTTYIRSPYDQTIEEILITPTSRQLEQTRAFAMSLGIPVPQLPGSRQTAISGVTMRPMPANFRACLNACLTETGDLEVSCELRDGSYFERVIPLAPIAEKIKQMIRHYHTNVLHGDMREETVSGIGDWYRTAVSAAARVAHSKAAKQIWKEVQAHHGQIEAGLMMVNPPAAVALRTGMAVHDMVAKAKDGDPVAAADVASIVSLANQGDPKAQQVNAMMRSMNQMMNLKNAKAEATVMVGRKHRKKHRRGGGRNRGRGRDYTQPDYPQDEDQGYGNAPPSPSSYSRSSDDYGYPDSGYDEDMRELASDDVASGWLFNRPYRAAAITPGLALRGFYTLGLAT